jgi:hypothetical protein
VVIGEFTNAYPHVLLVSHRSKLWDSFIFSFTWLATEGSLVFINGLGEYTASFFRVIT